MIKRIKRMQFLKSSYLFFVTIITLIFDSCVMIFVRQSTHTGGVAIVRLDAIGDFVLWLDVAKEFRNLYPNAKLTLIANQAWSDLARLLPYWDDVIMIDRKKFTRDPVYRFKKLKQMRLLGIETAIQTSYSREFRLGDSLIRAVGAIRRIGSIGDLSNIISWQKKISDKWYSQLITAKEEPLMELQRNAEFMRGLGLRNSTAGIPSLPSVADLPENLMIEQSYFVIFPGASSSGRLWPAKRFGELLLKLTGSNRGIAVLCGSRQERALCARIIDSSGTKALNMAGETTLPELVEVIRRAKFLVGNETSAVHIAAAVGTPSVCILGGGHYGRFLPYVVDSDEQIAPVPVVHRMDCFGCNWQCTRTHARDMAFPCILRIPVHEVFQLSETITKR